MTPPNVSPTRRRGRPPGGMPITDRHGVILAALRAVERRGPDATMDDIAAEAAVTKPIVYRLLGDKSALTMALSEWLIDRIDTATNAATTEGSDPRLQFRSAMSAYLDTVRTHRSVFLFVGAGGQSAHEVQRLVERSAQRMISVFGDARDAIGVDRVGAHTWAYALVGALQTTMIMWQPDRSPDQIADDLTALFWDGLADSLHITG
jgi:AcrR family transcriptional regulator